MLTDLLSQSKPATTTIYQGTGAPRLTDRRNEDGTLYVPDADTPKEVPTVLSGETADATSN